MDISLLVKFVVLQLIETWLYSENYKLLGYPRIYTAGFFSEI